MSEVNGRFSDAWFSQWPVTDSYLASDGHVNRIPLRLTSTNLVIYGTATLDEVLKEFEHEAFRPVTVGGKVPVQIWFNNFTDTDCGPVDRVNAYVETWYSFPVTPKASPLDLPYESPFSLNVMHPEALVWLQRVLCGADKHGNAIGARAAIAVGREVWGFPKHPAVAELSFVYAEDGAIRFSGGLHGKKAITVRAGLPENTPGSVAVPVDARTAPDACLTPNQNPLVPGFIPKQTRYGQAFSATMHFAPWDAAADSLEVHDEDVYYGALLKSWNFVPELKMHATDFKIVAFKPDGWNASHWKGA